MEGGFQVGVRVGKGVHKWWAVGVVVCSLTGDLTNSYPWTEKAGMVGRRVSGQCENLNRSSSLVKGVFAMVLIIAYIYMGNRAFVASTARNATPPSHPQRIDIRLQKIVRIRPEVIIQHPITIRLELNQLPRRAPLRPTRQANPHIRIQIMHKVKIVPADALRRVVRQHPIEHLQDIAPVERPQNRRPIVVRREVRPRLHGGVDLRGGLEEHAPRQREGQVTQDGADALELRVPDVQQARAEGAAVLEHVLVGADQRVDLGGAGVVEEDGGEVGRHFARGGQVRGEEAEQRALVFLVADDEGYLCVLAGCDAELGALG